MKPPLCFTMPYTVARPSPVPRPCSFVVKNGSKTRSFVSVSMPTPVSLTASITYRPGSDTVWSLIVRFVERGVRRFDRETAAGRHRIPGVRGEVDDDLLQLRPIRADRFEIRRQRRDEIDVLADHAAQQDGRVPNERVDVEDGGNEHLLAAERQQLSGEGRAPFGRFDDLVDVVGLRIVGIQ